jgi:prefoldin subunit 5
MDFYREVDKRKTSCQMQLGQLVSERYSLERDIESMQKRIAEIDKIALTLEATIAECERAQRDFNKYLAEREGALTMDDIKSGVEAAREEAERQDEKHKKK